MDVSRLAGFSKFVFRVGIKIHEILQCTLLGLYQQSLQTLCIHQVYAEKCSNSLQIKHNNERESRPHPK